MNRADLQMALGQADNLGDTLLRNRMLKQQEKQRQDDLLRQQSQFDDQMQLRRDELNEQREYRTTQTEATKQWRTQQQDQETLQAYLKANADGSLDDAGRAKANQWLAQHPYFSAAGLQIAPPAKRTGSMETSATRNAQFLFQLQEELQAAQAAGDLPKAQQIEQRIANFEKFTSRGDTTGDDEFETVVEKFPAVEGTEGKPGQPGEKRTGLMGIDWLAKDKPAIPGTPGTPGTPERTVTTRRKIGSGSSGQPAADGKVLDASTAKQFLEQAGGDKAKAREMARAAGYTF